MSGPASSDRVRRALPYVALAVALVIVGVLTAETSGEDVPLDPESTGPAGTRALVETVERLGARVDVSREGPGEDVSAVLVLADDLGDAAREDLREWARGGGTLVVADPGSPLSPDVVGTTQVGFVTTTLPRECDLSALAYVERVAAPGAAVYEAPGGATTCFPRSDGHWLVAESVGDGTLVSLGGPGVFTNSALDDADNALLIAALLLGGDDPRVHLQQPPRLGSGDAALTDLIPDRVVMALWQLLIAFVVVIAWRSRRLGRPVTEVQPVALPGSELTLAVGNLMQAGATRAQAAELLRDEFAHALAERFGLPPGSDPEHLARAAGRAGADHDRVLAILRAPPPADEPGLVAFAADVDAAWAATFHLRDEKRASAVPPERQGAPL